MSQSLKAKFNGNSKEVVAYAKKEGVSRAMEWFGVKDYVHMLEFLKEQEPGYKFSYGPPDVALVSDPDTFAEALLRQFAKQEIEIRDIKTENENLRVEITHLNDIIKKLERSKRELSRPVMEKLLKICESE